VTIAQERDISLFFFVTGHHEVCPTGEPDGEVGLGRVARTLVTRKGRKSLFTAEMTIY